MDNRIRYVYKIFDKLNEDKFYIGTTFDIKQRWNEHKRNSNSHKLKADMLEFGKQAFDIEILFSETENKAYDEEMRLIAELKPYYNNKNDRGGGKFSNDNIGENNPQAILVRQDILDICDRVVVNGEQVSEVAKDYPQVTENHICHIVNGDAWDHMKEAPRRKAGEIDIKGENNGNAKLIRQDIIDICDRVVVNGERVIDVAKDYPQVVEEYIYSIVNGASWKHVKEAPRRKVGESDTKGENHVLSKLTEQDVIDMCNRVVIDNELASEVAKDYPQVVENYIYAIISGDAWEHVKEAPRRKPKKNFTKDEVLEIRTLAFEGKTAEDIQEYICPHKEVRAVERVITGKSFRNYEGPIMGEDYHRRGGIL